MRRRTTFTATLVAAMALPGLAQASTGTVLSLTQKHHEVQIVSSNKSVHAYSFSGGSPAPRAAPNSHTQQSAHTSRGLGHGAASAASASSEPSFAPAVAACCSRSGTLSSCA